jgi:deoxyhypusine synthase
MPRKVEDIRVDDLPGVDTLLRRMATAGGFSSQQLTRGTDLLHRMLADRGMTLFLSFPADIVATGTRGVLHALLETGRVGCVITTCGTLDHDIARSRQPYFHGEWNLDDAELYRRKLYRLGNLVIPRKSYGPPVEREMTHLLESLWRSGRRTISTHELVWQIGERLSGAAGRGSLARVAFERKIPVIIPGITDGAVGSQLWFFAQRHRGFSVDLFADEQKLSDLVFEAKRTGAILLGGGISKHHTIWWNQFRDGLDAALYLTTAVEWDGSLSGARTREAVSWGKLKPTAQHQTVEGDITVLLPLMVEAALARRAHPGTASGGRRR